MENQYTLHSIPKKVRVWGRGQFTIPAEIREKLNISDGTILSVLQIGKALLAVPETPKVIELAREVKHKLATGDLGVKELLTELREGRHAYKTEED
ncbi:MAG: AbrB/MazE/SpoVT family DNA-binding domain-containing protein [Bacillota bacterium]